MTSGIWTASTLTPSTLNARLCREGNRRLLPQSEVGEVNSVGIETISCYRLWRASWEKALQDFSNRRQTLQLGCIFRRFADLGLNPLVGNGQPLLQANGGFP